MTRSDQGLQPSIPRVIPFVFHPDTQTRAKRVFQFLERKVAQGALDPFMLDVYHVAKAVMSQGLVDHANNMLHGNYEKEEKTSG